jgi:hypothetical protein
MLNHVYKIIYINYNSIYLTKNVRTLNYNLLILCWIYIEFVDQIKKLFSIAS